MNKNKNKLKKHKILEIFKKNAKKVRKYKIIEKKKEKISSSVWKKCFELIKLKKILKNLRKKSKMFKK